MNKYVTFRIKNEMKVDASRNNSHLGIENENEGQN